jgi:hypothetical protein
MTTSRTVKTKENEEFVCCYNNGARSVCALEKPGIIIEDKPYCILHYANPQKNSTEFNEAVERKMSSNDFNFKNVWFPPSYQWPFGMEFSNAIFVDACFSSDAVFELSRFSEHALFGRAAFNAGAYFYKTIFKAAANFNYAKFAGPIDFHEASFGGIATFEGATFTDEVRFVGRQDNKLFSDTSLLSLQFAKFQQPHLVSFHTVTLRPGWFVNVDPRKFEFTDVEWKWRSVSEEIATLHEVVAVPHRMLAIACRHLAVNAEENHRYEDASRFRYMSMDAARLENWGGFGFWRLSWWYWLASGYGERIWRAAVMLLSLMIVCAALYTKVGFARWEPRMNSQTEAVVGQRDEVGAPLKLSRALTYSAGVMTFQRPEPRPATTAAQTVVLLETILGPVQAALLALAIRRKFMR